MAKQTMNFELSTYLGYFLYTVLPTGAPYLQRLRPDWCACW